MHRRSESQQAGPDDCVLGTAQREHRRRGSPSPGVVGPAALRAKGGAPGTGRGEAEETWCWTRAGAGARVSEKADDFSPKRGEGVRVGCAQKEERSAERMQQQRGVRRLRRHWKLLQQPKDDGADAPGVAVAKRLGVLGCKARHDVDR
eukprot:scaffold27547_cov96-Isochrysis_galbana.AAC.2